MNVAAVSILRRKAYLCILARGSVATRLLSYDEKQHLSELERSSNQNPHDPYRQYDFISQLVESDPKFVVRRIETGRYAMNKEVYELYEQALIKSGKKTTAPEADENVFGRFRFKSDGFSFIRAITTVNNFLSLLLIPGLALLLLWRALQRTNKDLLGTRDFSADIPEHTFDDVAGNLVAKRKMKELVQFLKDPESFQAMGCKSPKGVLLSGPPGVGKTLLAKCLAGEANVPFYFASGSEFDQMFVGLGARRIRQLFTSARQEAPAIIFIDEIDTVGQKRGWGGGSRNSVNQLLSEMDGFEDYCGVIVIAATNDPKVLDEALVREGRFDIKINMVMPCTRDRIEILKVHTRNKPLAEDADIETLAKACVGMSGAQLATMINTAGLRAVHKGKTAIDNEDLEYARAKVLLGGVNTSLHLSDEDLGRVATNQAGVAVMALLREKFTDMSIYLASVEPRSWSMGQVHSVPNEDRYSITNEELLARIDTSLGGRVAEELLGEGGEFGTTVVEQVDHVNKLAKILIEENGYSRKQGFVRYSDSHLKNIQTAQLVQAEVRELLAERHDIVKRELTAHKSQLIRMKDTLVSYKSLTGEECRTVFSGGRLTRQPSEGLPSSD